MKKKLMIFLGVIFLLTISGCTTKLEYTPKATISVEQAKKDIKVLIFAQLNKYQPGEVKITNEFIEYTWANKNISRGTVYYFHIGEIRLLEKRGVYYVKLINKQKDTLIKAFYYRNINDAKAFINALTVLMNNSENRKFEY